jgi:hypothetical protein
MIGYKVCKAGDTRVIVTLKIPADAITNMGRKSAVVRETAKYRTNKAKVLKIEDEAGREYTHAKSFGYDTKSLEYTLDKTICVEDYDVDLEAVCAPGIHYFLEKRCAEFYGLHTIGRSTIQNGLYQTWYDNGQKELECTYVNGRLDGLYQLWYENGQKELECTYVNGRTDGLYQEWFINGKLYNKRTYVNGKCVVIHDMYVCNSSIPSWFHQRVYKNNTWVALDDSIV